MTIQELGSIGEFVAAIATLVTLAYLAVQIRQSTSVARSAAKQEVLNSHRELIRELLTLRPELHELFTRGMHSFVTLDLMDQQRFHLIMTEYVLHAQNARQLQQKGVLDTADAEVWTGFALQILRMPGSIEWWTTARGVFDPEYAAEIDEGLQA